MSNNKTRDIALLGAMAMMSSQSVYTNAYEGLTDYSDRPYTKSISKTRLSKKQKKSRAKSKAARKARKKMSNNKQSMKLYTEEQLKKAIELAQECEHECGGVYFDYTEKEIIDELTPIELPSDEEIREERLLQFPDSEYANRANDRLAFYCGARFVINKIQGGNNEH